MKKVESFVKESKMLQWDTDTTYPKKVDIHFAISKHCLSININTDEMI